MKKLTLLSAVAVMSPVAFSQSPPPLQTTPAASAPAPVASPGRSPFAKAAPAAKAIVGPPSPTTALVLVDSAGQTLGRTSYVGNNTYHVVIPYQGDYVTAEVWPDYNPAYDPKNPTSKRYNSGGLVWKRNLELGNVAVYTSANCSGQAYISPSTYGGTTWRAVVVSDGPQTYLLVGNPADTVTGNYNSYYHNARCYSGLLGNGELPAYPATRFENVLNYGTPPFTIK